MMSASEGGRPLGTDTDFLSSIDNAPASHEQHEAQTGMRTFEALQTLNEELLQKDSDSPLGKRLSASLISMSIDRYRLDGATGSDAYTSNERIVRVERLQQAVKSLVDEITHLDLRVNMLTKMLDRMQKLSALPGATPTPPGRALLFHEHILATQKMQEEIDQLGGIDALKARLGV